MKRYFLILFCTSISLFNQTYPIGKSSLLLSIVGDRNVETLTKNEFEECFQDFCTYGYQSLGNDMKSREALEFFFNHLKKFLDEGFDNGILKTYCEIVDSSKKKIERKPLHISISMPEIIMTRSIMAINDWQQETKSISCK